MTTRPCLLNPIPVKLVSLMNLSLNEQFRKKIRKVEAAKRMIAPVDVGAAVALATVDGTIRSVKIRLFPTLKTM